MITAITYDFYSDKDGERKELLYRDTYYPNDVEDLIRVVNLIKEFPAKYELITKTE